MKFDIKSLRFDLIAVVICALLACVYCYPQFQGKLLEQHDNISWQAAAHEAKSYHETTGKDALWTNCMFGGMPSYTIYTGATSYNFLSYVQNILQIVGKPSYFFFIAMVCFYLLMRVMKQNRWVAMLGAYAYAFATYNPIIIQVGHETKMLTMGYLPAALAGLYLIYTEKWLQGAALWGISVALMVANNHFQVIYYSLFMFFFFGVVMLIDLLKKGELKTFFVATAITVVAGLLGVGTGTSSILTTNEYAKETMRGGGSELKTHDVKKSGGLDKEYAFRWSNGVGELLCVMIPYLYGGASGEDAEMAPKANDIASGRYPKLPLYWGPQPFLSGPMYFGAIICFLFVLGLLVVPNNHKWWVLAASVFCAILSTGKNMAGFNYFLFDHLPMLNKFRTPSMAMVIPQLLFSVMAVWALHTIIEGGGDKKQYIKQVFMAAGITAGLCVLIALFGGIFFDFKAATDTNYPEQFATALKQDRGALASKSAMISAAYILLAAGLLYAYLNGILKNVNIILGCIGFLIVVDLYPTAQRYLNDSHYVDATEYDNTFKPTPADAAILSSDKDPYYRVLDLSRDTYNDAVQGYFHKCIGGYSPAKMEIYQDMIEHHIGNLNTEVLNMLNTKYIIAGGGEKGGNPQVMPNKDACGNAWFVREIKWANTADEEINALNAPSLRDTTAVPNSFKPLQTAVIRNTFKGDIGNYTFGKDSSSTIKLTQYGLDELSYQSQNSQAGLAVFSDIYYKNGWKAYIDGKETPIVKANYILRCIKIPAGSHKIDFVFKPESFYMGRNVDLACNVLLILLGIGSFIGLKKKQG